MGIDQHRRKERNKTSNKELYGKSEKLSSRIHSKIFQLSGKTFVLRKIPSISSTDHATTPSLHKIIKYIRQYDLK